MISISCGISAGAAHGVDVVCIYSVHPTAASTEVLLDSGVSCFLSAHSVEQFTTTSRARQQSQLTLIMHLFRQRQISSSDPVMAFLRFVGEFDLTELKPFSPRRIEYLTWVLRNQRNVLQYGFTCWHHMYVIRAVRFASETKTGCSMNLKTDSVKSNVPIMAFMHVFSLTICITAERVHQL